MSGVQLDETVARLAHEAALLGQERPVRGQRPEQRDPVVTVDGLAADAGVGRDQCRGGRVHGGRVGTPVVRTAAAVPVDGGVVADVQPVVARRALQGLQPAAHDHAVASRIGDVLGEDAIPAAPGGAGHEAGHTALVRRPDRVGRVPRLEVGEGGAVGDDVLERLHVGVVDGRAVDVGEDAVGHREPDLRGLVARGANAVLPRQVEVRERSRPVVSRWGRRRPRPGRLTRTHRGKPEHDARQRGGPRAASHALPSDR